MNDKGQISGTPHWSFWLVLIGIVVLLILSFVKVGGAVPFENQTGQIYENTLVTWTTKPYTDVLRDSFFVVLLMVPIGLTWMKTRNMGSPLLVAIVGAAVMSPLLYSNELQTMFTWFIAIGIAILLFKIAISRMG